MAWRIQNRSSYQSSEEDRHQVVKRITRLGIREIDHKTWRPLVRTDKLGLSLLLECKTGFVVVFVVIGATAAAASFPIILCRTIRTMKPIRRV